MSAVAGGPPVRLVKGPEESEYAGSWSPDEKWFVYWGGADRAASLNKVKTTGEASVEVVKANTDRNARGRGSLLARRQAVSLTWGRRTGPCCQTSRAGARSADSLSGDVMQEHSTRFGPSSLRSVPDAIELPIVWYHL